MSSSSIRAYEVKECQPVVLPQPGAKHKILVRGDLCGTYGHVPVISQFIQGKIPFSQVGFIDNGQFKFYSTPVDIVHLPETQVLELISCSLNSWLNL